MNERIKKLKEFQKKTKIKFKNLSLLNQALTHSSYSYEKLDRPEHNERLEFLGDAVLSLLIVEYLYENYKNLYEGKLSQIKAFIISENVLSSIAKKLGIQDYLLLGKGEENSGGREKSSIISGALEAIIGAYYIDSGIKKVRKFVVDNFLDFLKNIEDNLDKIKDWKTKFQELIQKRLKQNPDYVLILEKGPDHKKVFQVGVKVGDKIIGIGEGFSKKEAEQNAAENAFQNFQKEDINLEYDYFIIKWIFKKRE